MSSMEEDLPNTLASGAEKDTEVISEKDTATIVEGKYRIFNDKVVGRGALSTVKKCETIFPYVPQMTTPGMKLVVKEIDKAFLLSIADGDIECAAAQVKGEVKILEKIPPHENIATFIEYIETPTHYLLFFEEVQCGDLCEIILSTETRRLPEAKAKKYAYQIIKAVLHCHLHGICHRDIKPENLLLSETDNLKLTDFGLAKYGEVLSTKEQKNGVTPCDTSSFMMPYPGGERLLRKELQCSNLAGTPRYGAPEMFYAKITKKSYDGFKADGWAIGVVTFILLAGSFPFGSDSGCSNEEQFNIIMERAVPQSSTISPLAMDFINHLLTKDPDMRVELVWLLNHPWLAEVVEPRQSKAVSLVRRRLSEYPVVPLSQEDLLRCCDEFDVEARGYQQYIAQLQWRISELIKNSKEEKESKVSKEKSNSRTGGSVSAVRNSLAGTSTSTRLRATTPRPVSTFSSSYISRDRATTPRPTSMNSRLYNTSSPERRAGSSSTPRMTGFISSGMRDSGLGGGRTSSRPQNEMRRETPLRTGVRPQTFGNPSLRGISPARGPSLAGPASSSSTSSILRPSRLISPTPRASTPSRGLGVTRDKTTPASTFASLVTPRQSSGTAGRVAGIATPRLAGTRGTLPKDLCLGEEVMYKGNRAVVRFNGSTDFGTGTWIGLEMLEGEGLNDGYSFVDKKTYFSCPKGKGIFARAFQITKTK